MVNKKKNRKLWFYVFAIIYFCFLILSLVWPSSLIVAILKVGSIFLCLLYVLTYNFKDKLLVIALVATFAADVILAINNVAVSGVIIFIIAQITHFTRLSQKLKRNLISYGIIISLMVVLAIVRRADIMYVIGGVYALLLLSNLFMSFRWYLSSKKLSSRCAFFGFLLFLACDLCVAISYLSLTGIFSYFLYDIANYLAWVFYLPSQILISNSSKHVIQ